MQTSFNEKKEIERLANNAPNLKDWGDKGLNQHGGVKKGYHRLKDNRVIKKSDLLPVQAQERQYGRTPQEIEEQAEKFPKLFNCANLAKDANGNLKKGYYQLKSGKVISLNKLEEAITNNIDVEASSID